MSSYLKWKWVTAAVVAVLCHSSVSAFPAIRSKLQVLDLQSPYIGSYVHPCLDIRGASRANNASVILWRCHGGANQQWYQSGDRIRTRLNGKCLDIRGARVYSGVPVTVYTCYGSLEEQRWKPAHDDSSGGGYLIQNLKVREDAPYPPYWSPTYCLDVRNWRSVGFGSHMQLSKCTGRSSQKFSLHGRW